MENRHKGLKLLIVLIVLVLAMSVTLTAFAAQTPEPVQHDQNIEQAEITAQGLLVWSWIVIAAGSLVVAGIMLHSVIICGRKSKTVNSYNE